MYYYTYNTHILAAAGIVGILVIAVVLTALLAVLVLPKHKDGKLPAFFQLLFDAFTPKTAAAGKDPASAECLLLPGGGAAGAGLDLPGSLRQHNALDDGPAAVAPRPAALPGGIRADPAADHAGQGHGGDQPGS